MRLLTRGGSCGRDLLSCGRSGRLPRSRGGHRRRRPSGRAARRGAPTGRDAGGRRQPTSMWRCTGSPRPRVCTAGTPSAGRALCGCSTKPTCPRCGHTWPPSAVTSGLFKDYRVQYWARAW